MLNAAQRRIAMTGLLLVLVMALIPPWHVWRIDRQPVPRWLYSHSEGYAFLLTPPRVVSGNSDWPAAEIDLARLVTQCVIVSALTGIGICRRGRESA